MVLPHAPGQCREVEICVTRSADALDIHADIVFVDHSDSSSLDTVQCESSNSHSSFKSPYSNRCIDPVFVAPLLLEACYDVPVATRQDEDGKNDMPGQEEFIDSLSDRQDRRWEKYRHAKSGNYAPNPIG